MFTENDFSLGELAIVRQQLQNEEFERKIFIEKMLSNFAEDHDTFMQFYDESVDVDDIEF